VRLGRTISWECRPYHYGRELRHSNIGMGMALPNCLCSTAMMWLDAAQRKSQLSYILQEREGGVTFFFSLRGEI